MPCVWSSYHSLGRVEMENLSGCSELSPMPQHPTQKIFLFTLVNLHDMFFQTLPDIIVAVRVFRPTSSAAMTLVGEQ